MSYKHFPRTSWLSRPSRLSTSRVVLFFGTVALVASCAGDPESGGTATAAEPGATPSQTSALDPFELARVQAYLDSQYRREDVHHTFTTRFSQPIDCVDFYAQPAVKSLPANTVVMPAHVPVLRGANSTAPLITDLTDGSADGNGQTRRCPDGTVPIVHQNAEDIVRAGGLEQHLLRLGSTPPIMPHAPPPPGSTSSRGVGSAVPGSPPPPAVAGYHYALGVDMNLPGTGTAGLSHLAAYDPYVLPGSREHSISQIWVTSPGSNNPCSAPNCVQTLEAGWNVDINLYGNSSTHFFIFSTRDGYQFTGCYNMATTCLNQLTPTTTVTATGSNMMLLPGTPLTPGQIIASSSVGATPVDELYVAWSSSNDGNWYLNATGGTVGFIAQAGFNNGQGGGQPLTRFAARFEAGGEVYDSAPGGVHTSTQMGSGRITGIGGYGTVAYQRTVQYGIDLGDNSGDSEIFDAPLTDVETDSDFYSIAESTPAGGTGWNSYFYFGGPGQLQTPTGLTAHGGNASASLSWNLVPGARGYVVWRSTTSGTGFSPVGSTNDPTTTYTDTGLTNGTTYFYVVSANASEVVSGQSTQVSVTPSNGTLPAAPTGVTESVSTGKVTIKWSAVSGATGYAVQRSTVTGGPYTRIASVTTTSYSDTAVTHGTTYFYVVAATNAAGQGPNSRQVSGRP